MMFFLSYLIVKKSLINFIFTCHEVSFSFLFIITLQLSVLQILPVIKLSFLIQDSVNLISIQLIYLILLNLIDMHIKYIISTYDK